MNPPFGCRWPTDGERWRVKTRRSGSALAAKLSLIGISLMREPEKRRVGNSARPTGKTEGIFSFHCRDRSGLTAAYSVRFIDDVFFNGEPRGQKPAPHEPPRWRSGMALVIGLFLGPRSALRPAFVQAPLDLREPRALFTLACIVTLRGPDRPGRIVRFARCLLRTINRTAERRPEFVHPATKPPRQGHIALHTNELRQ